MSRSCRGVLAPLLIPACLCLVTFGQTDDGQFRPLCDGKSLKGWKSVSADASADAENTWVVTDGLLRCSGKPNGYLRTSEQFRNFILKLEWRYTNEKDGNNSGVLLHCQEPDGVWPSSIQVQLHNPEAGSIYAFGESKADNEAPVKGKAKQVGEWNSLEMICQDGRITVVLNGEKVGEVTGATPDKGYIGLQSEGAEIHFRKILIKPL